LSINKETLKKVKNMKEIIKELIIKDLISTYGPIDNIEPLIQVRENKDLTKGEYSVSFHAFANAINKKK
jgi:hypothetical protein